MKEDFIQFIWRFGYFDKTNLITSTNESIKIIHPGHLNHDAGPDFLNGQIQIGAQIWHGHIEIHTKASDWKKHGHSQDPQYHNVILHVVYSHDVDILYPDGKIIPTLELAHRISPNMRRNNEQLMSQMSWIPCSGILANHYSDLKWAAWSEHLVVERLSDKIERLETIFDSNRGDWKLTLYTWLAYGFGLKVNAEAFIRMAKRLSPKLISQYRDQPDMVHALFYGSADMLKNNFTDPYPKTLQKEWAFLSKKHDLVFQVPILWKFHRMRPSSFPSLRISQFAQLLLNHSTLLDLFIETERVSDLETKFQLKAHDYWKDHNKFDHEVKPQSINTGKMFFQQLLINVIVPYLFFYGKKMGKQELKDRSIEWLQQVKAENNNIMRKWQEEGIVAKNGADSQALYHLKNNYCDHKLCMQCSFGHSILKKDK